MNIDIYPFFLECSRRVEQRARKTQLQRLAFGIGGHIINRDTAPILMMDDGEFAIPAIFSQSAWDVLAEKLWPNDKFERLQRAIFEARRSWTNAKKKDKLRMVDKYILTRKYAGKYDMMIDRSVITLALILKLISPKSVEFDNFEIIALKDLDVAYEFTNSTPPTLLLD